MSERQTLGIVQLGLGKVGRALIKLHLDMGADPRISWVAVGDRSGVWVIPDGWSNEALHDVIGFKAMGMPLTRWHPEAFGAEQVEGSEAYSPELLWRLDELGLHKALIVDITSPIGQTLPLLKMMRRGDYNMLLSSTSPLSDKLEDYHYLLNEGKGRLKYYPAISGQLPVLQLMDALRIGGDRIRAIDVAPSATLNLATEKLAQGSAFSQAVREAAGRGLSETDPREDLSGRDSARRMLILARALGLQIEMTDVRRQSLLPDGLDVAPLPEFWGRLGELDHGLGVWSWEASQRGNMLRYMAHIEPPGTLELRMVEVSKVGLAGAGSGSSDIYLIYTDRNGDQPIVLRGPASGPMVTAAAMYAEIIGFLERPTNTIF